MTVWYSIKDWDKHFENSESRKVKSLTWVKVENKHDGKGYRRVAAHPKSIQVFCAWSLIIQVASKMPVRGVLRDDDGPICPSDLAYKTGYPEHIFVEAFKVLCEPKIGWLLRHEAPDAPETSRHPGMEQKGTEGNSTESSAPPQFPYKPLGMGSGEGDGSETVANGAKEIPTEEQAVAMCMTAGIDEKFVRYVYGTWASRSGKDGAGILVDFVPLVTKRWKNEQTEWKAGTHNGNRNKMSGRHNSRLDGQSDKANDKRNSAAAAIAASET